jgi:hypothetical protein
MARSTSASKKKHRAMPSEPFTVEAERHRQLVMDVYEKVLKPLDESRVDEFFRSDYIQHNPMAERGGRSKSVSQMGEERFTLGRTSREENVRRSELCDCPCTCDRTAW